MTARSNVDGAVIAGGVIALPRGKAVPLRAVRMSVRANQRVTLSLALRRADAATVRRALARNPKLQARIGVRAEDAAHRSSRTTTFRVTLKR